MGLDQVLMIPMLTYDSPRNHVWTYAATGGTLSAYTCPEIGDDITKQPAFVGQNYICVVASKLVAIGSDKLFDVPLFTYNSGELCW